MSHPDGTWQPHPQQPHPQQPATGTAWQSPPGPPTADQPPPEVPGRPAPPEGRWRPEAAAAARATVRAQPGAPAFAARAALPRAVPATPPDPPPRPPSELSSDRTGPSGRTARLHIGWHSVPRGAGQVRVTTTPPTGAGLLLGRNRPIQLLSAEPTRTALVGGLWAAQLLIFRAFALGARAIVVTTDPRSWSGFGERATGQYNRLTVLSSDQGGFPAGTPRMPTLIVYDLGTTAPTTPPTPAPWQTRLTLLRHLDRPGLATVQDAGLVLLQRLDGDESTLAASALRLPAADARLLTSLADDMIARFAGDADDYFPLSPTPVEQQLLGPPRR